MFQNVSENPTSTANTIISSLFILTESIEIHSTLKSRNLKYLATLKINKGLQEKREMAFQMIIVLFFGKYGANR